MLRVRLFMMSMRRVEISICMCMCMSILHQHEWQELDHFSQKLFEHLGGLFHRCCQKHNFSSAFQHPRGRTL